MSKRPGATKLSYLLWGAAAVAVLLLILASYPATKTKLDYMLAAELLLVVVLAVEGIVAARELAETRRQLRFDAVIRIYDFSREVHSLAFLRPKLWKSMSLQRTEPWDEERELRSRYEQLFTNLLLLEWEADQHGYFDKAAWERDAKAAMRRPARQEFWKTHAELYPEDFRKWVDDIIGEPPIAREKQE